MSNIVTGDNGTVLEIAIRDDVGYVDISTATSIVAHIVRGDRSTVEKTLTVVDATLGTCRAVLNAEDVSVYGAYSYQVTVTFSGGNVFTSNNQQFFVNRKL